jgi:hypothetical protein
MFEQVIHVGHDIGPLSLAGDRLYRIRLLKLSGTLRHVGIMVGLRQLELRGVRPD